MTDSRKMNTSDFKELAEIGQGSYSEIQLVRELPTRALRALKVVSIKLLKKEHKERQASREKDNILACQECKNVINLASTFLDNRMLTLNYVLEFVPNGDLQTRLRHIGSSLCEKDTTFVLGQLVSAVEYMHSKNIIHRDLKPENCLFTYENELKLCDFGTTIDCVKEKPNTFLGSAYYVAPEIITTKLATFGTDYWGLGVILFELLVGCKMFPGRSEYYVMQKIETMKHVEIPENCPFTEEIKGLVNHDQEIRTATFKKLQEKLGALEKNEGKYKFQAFCPVVPQNIEYFYEDFSDITNYEELMKDETDDVAAKIQDLDQPMSFGTVDKKKDLVEVAQDSVYFGEKIDRFFSGIFSFDERTKDVLRLQHKYNKWSMYLSKTELILMQGELYTLTGYYRKQLETDKENIDDIDTQMWLVVIDLNDVKNKRSLIGIVSGKVKYKIDLCKNQCSEQKVEFKSLGEGHFCVLKQHPDRTWFFEIDDDDSSESWVKAMGVEVPENLLGNVNVEVEAVADPFQAF